MLICLLTGYDVSEGKFYAVWRKGKWVVGNLVLKLDKGIYVYKEAHPPTVLSFFSFFFTQRLVFLSNTTTPLFISSPQYSLPSVQRSPASCPCPA
jgi:hypothetical protein